MPTYDEMEGQNGDPRELYSFALANGSFNLTTHIEDVVYNAVTYTATAGLSRGNVYQSPLTRHRECEIVLPRNHPIVMGLIPTPPRVAHVSIVRIHSNATSASSDRRQIHFGELAKLALRGKDAQIQVPGAIDVAFDVDVPILRAQRACQHQLYSVGCTVPRSAPMVKTPTVSSVNGIEIAVSTLGAWADQTARFGEIVRTSDGERRSILSQIGNDLIIDVPFSTLSPGDALEVARGCDKQVATCRGDFLNVKNYGGHPLIPDSNPASPTGRGIS